MSHDKVCLSQYKYTEELYNKRRLFTPNDSTALAANKYLLKETVQNIIWNEQNGKKVLLFVKFLNSALISEQSQALKEEKVKTVIEAKINQANFIGIAFQFVAKDQDAHIRIHFAPNEGSWSLHGKEALLDIDQESPTMNLAWLDDGNILHQFGHAMGFLHECKWVPSSELLFDAAVVARAYSGYPHLWTPEETKRNFLDIFNIDQFLGDQFDPGTLMQPILPCDFFTKKTTVRCTDANFTLPADYSYSDKQNFAAFYPIANNGTFTPTIRKQQQKKVDTTTSFYVLQQRKLQPGTINIFQYLRDVVIILSALLLLLIVVVLCIRFIHCKS
jgi:hypothetical protein